MELKKLSERIYISPFEDLRDRPALGYVKGDKYILNIDAGYSLSHVQEYYDALKENNLEYPDMTILTHWHWDHSFGLHATKGISIAERRSNEYIKEAMENPNFEEELKTTNEAFALEFKDQEMHIEMADITFDDTIEIDLGNLHAIAFNTISPHNDDCVLIYIPEEKVLFVGDAIGGKYPDWSIDPNLNQGLINTIQNLDFTTAVGSHWPIFTKERLIDDLIHMRLV